MLFDGEMSEELRNLVFTHLLRMTFSVEEDVAADPIDVGLLGANTVMFAANDAPHLIEQFWFARGRRSHYSV